MKFKKLIMNCDIAEKHGYNAAILLHHVSYWTEFNKRRKNESAKRDGVYWTYQTQKQIADQFPGINADNVKDAMQILADAKLIIKKRFFVGKSSINHYRVTDQGRKFSANFTYRGGILYNDEYKMFKSNRGKSTISTGGKVLLEEGDSSSTYIGIRKEKKKRKNGLTAGGASPAKSLVSLLDDREAPSANQIRDIIYAFSEGGKRKMNYGNETHRESAENLISEHGFEQTIAMVKQILEINKIPFAPTAYNPWELENKMPKIKDFILKKNIESASKVKRTASI